MVKFMNTWNPKDAKHRTANSLHELRQSHEVIEVYDDEEPGMLMLYVADGELRWPARTVSLRVPDHAQRVIRAWACGRKLVDRRLDKSGDLVI